MKTHRKSTGTKSTVSYEPEADVLTWEITDKPIDYAKEVDRMVVHFTKDNTPVLVEILQASKFLSRANTLLKKRKILPKKSLALAY